MKDRDSSPNPSRRRFLSLAGAALAAGAVADATPALPAPAVAHGAVEPFRAARQGGIATLQQKHTYFAAFDLNAEKRQDVIELLREWTAAAERLAAGQPARPVAADLSGPAGDGGSALGLAPGRLTVTFGFGAGLFESGGNDRYGLRKYRPDALVDLPRFAGDQLAPDRTGGDLSVQACADDPQVAFHAVRELVRISYGAGSIRWVQSGFLSAGAGRETPRNLMGFKDGTSNPESPAELDEYVFCGDESPEWMQGGSYLVVRRIRIALEHWDRMPVAFQEQAVGRRKASGAPIGGRAELDKVDLDAADKDGNPLVAENSHVRLAIAQSNDGSRILRRAYSYNDGASFTSERWPPWTQGMEYDAGLLFICYQRDPRTGFIKIFGPMSQLDQLNQFLTHTGGGLFACPGGIAPNSYVGQGLLEAA